MGQPAAAPVPALQLWLRWALAPMRRQTYRWVRELHARQVAPVSVTPAPATTPLALHESGDLGIAVADPRLRHVLLLGATVRGESVSMHDVFALARAWHQQLDEAALARLHARALELDVRDGADQTRSLRDAVLEQLTELATNAPGALPAGSADGSLAAELASRARERLFKEVEAVLVPLDPDRMAPPLHPLEAWERWLQLRAVLERVEQQAGRVALTTLWHGGVRNTVWNWTCALFNQHHSRAAWVAHGMFSWVADRAEYLGDLSTTLINRENARIALRAAS